MGAATAPGTAEPCPDLHRAALGISAPPNSAPWTRNGGPSWFCHTSTREVDKLDQGQACLSLVRAVGIAGMCIRHTGP